MKFVAKQQKEGVNVSDTPPLIEAGTLAVGLTAIFVIIAVSLIFLVDITLFFVTPEDEADLFRDWLPEDLITVAPDDERLYQTQLLLDRLSQHWPDTAYTFRVEIDDSEVANAMALPGGLIIVTRGLLDQVQSENELAFVLGHELGHFKNRDHLRALGRGVALTMFLAVVTGHDVAGIGVRVADVTLRAFSRSQESKADRFGLTVVHAEYGHVSEAWRLLERWEVKDSASVKLVSYLSTHPGTGARIVDMQGYAAAQIWHLDGDVTPLGWSSVAEESPATLQ